MLVITLLSGGVLMIQAPIADRLVATSKMWVYFLAHILWAAVFVTGTYFWVSAQGSTGLALARLVAYFVNGAGIVAFVWWQTIREQRKSARSLC